MSHGHSDDEAAEANHSLASKAEECIASFQQCLYKAASVHPRELSLIEDQLARFSAWTGNMRVFGSMRQSLDHRLREAQDVRDTFDALLETIRYRTETCMSTLEALHPEQSDGAFEDVDQTFERAVHGIADQISLLHKLSNTIRRASKDVQNIEAAKAPRICDDEGNDAEDFLQQVFKHYIRDRFPTTSGTIQQRLAVTMVLRRKRILYRRSRYGNNPINVSNRTAPPVVSVPRAQLAVRSRKTDAHQKAADSQSQTQSLNKSLAQSATTLAAETFHKASTPSLVSVSKTVALGSHERLVFPTAPMAIIKKKQRQLEEERKRDPVNTEYHLNSQDRNTMAEDRTPTQDWEDAIDAVGEVVCPFCFHALPAREVVDDKSWEKHVVGDLDAYVCLFQECESPEKLYTHSSQWLKHMREHTLRWRCASKAHDDFVVTSREEYIEHMKAVHRTRLTDTQLRLLADKSSRSIGQIFESCPLCGTDEPRFSMHEHVIGHLRLLAIKSLPAYYVEDSEDPDNASAAESMTRRRSTLRDFTDASSFDFSGGSEPSETKDVSEFIRGAPKAEMKERRPREPEKPAEEATDDIWGWSSTEKDKKKGADSDALKSFWSTLSVPLAGSDNSSGTGGVELGENENRQHSGSTYDGNHSTVGASSSQYDHGQPGSSILEPSTPVFPQNHPVMLGGMDPSCAICHQPAVLSCDCEAKGLEAALRQAESRMMWSLYNDTRQWVRSHAENHVRTSFKRAASQVTASASEGTQVQSEVTEVQGDSGERISADMKNKLNQLWRDAVQTFPETLEYFFALVEFSLPPDDDPTVRDPPLSALAGSRKNRLHFKQEGSETSEPSSQKDLPRLPPLPLLSQKLTPAPGKIRASGETAATGGKMKGKADEIDS